MSWSEWGWRWPSRLAAPSASVTECGPVRPSALGSGFRPSSSVGAPPRPGAKESPMLGLGPPAGLAQLTVSDPPERTTVGASGASCDTVAIGLGEAVRVGVVVEVGVRVEVGVGVVVGEAVAVELGVGELLAVDVGEGLDVSVGLGVAVAEVVLVAVAVAVALGVGDGVAVGDLVVVDDGVGVAVVLGEGDV